MTGNKECQVAKDVGQQNCCFQWLSFVQLFATAWTAARQVSLPSISRSLLKLMSVESVMPSNHLILCHPLLLSSIFKNDG